MGRSPCGRAFQGGVGARSGRVHAAGISTALRGPPMPGASVGQRAKGPPPGMVCGGPMGVSGEGRRRRRRRRVGCRHRTGDFLGWDRSPPVPHLKVSVFVLADAHRALRRRIGPALSRHLEVAIVVPHHPVVGQGARFLQPKHLVQVQPGRDRRVEVLRRRGHPRKPLVVVVGVRGVEVRVGGAVVADASAPELLDQPVLVRTVPPLDSPLRLSSQLHAWWTVPHEPSR